MNIYAKKQHLPFRRLVISGATLVLIIVLLNLFQPFIKNSFYVVSGPLANRLQVAANGVFGFFAGPFLNLHFKEENDRLLQENRQLLTEVADLRDFVSAHQLEEQAAVLAKENTATILPATIVGQDIANDVIYLNKGLNDGIKEGMLVISDQKIVYGKTDQVLNSTARVMLVSHPAMVLDVKVEHTDSDQIPVYGVTKGKGASKLYLDLIPTDAVINPGDTLVTSALEGQFPKNLLVGKVISENKDDLKPFKTADIEPFFNLKDTGSLFVVTGFQR